MLWLWVALSMLGAVMTTTGKAAIIDRTEIEGFAIEEVHLRTLDGVHVAAWYLPVESDTAVVLLPGIGGNREHMRSRAAFYARNGVASIMPDFRGTGESDPSVVSIGWHERYDVEAAYRYLLARGYERVGAHGISKRWTTLPG
jgi:pimeloyl-ACP methyl ester carboxylesterase